MHEATAASSSSWDEPSDVEDELGLVCGGMFEEAVLIAPLEVAVSLPCHFELAISIPSAGYPAHRQPNVSVSKGPNAVLVSLLERSLVTRLHAELMLGGPMLAHIIQVAMEEAHLVDEDARRERQNKQQVLDAEVERLSVEAAHRFSHGIDILVGDPIVDRKSKFLAHVAKVQSLGDVLGVIAELRGHGALACAAHPAIYAYRFRDAATGVLHQDAEDDGETGASKKILFLLDQLHVDGYVVVVTRWFGGILLGPDRFKHIMHAAKSALVKHHIVEGGV